MDTNCRFILLKCITDESDIVINDIHGIKLERMKKDFVLLILDLIKRFSFLEVLVTHHLQVSINAQAQTQQFDSQSKQSSKQPFF